MLDIDFLIEKINHELTCSNLNVSDFAEKVGLSDMTIHRILKNFLIPIIKY